MSMRTVQIASADGDTTASFAPDANLVCCSLRHRGEELLHLGDGVDAYAQRGRTMGIPLLYPWANRLSAPGYAAAGREVALGELFRSLKNVATKAMHNALVSEYLQRRK